MNAVLQQIFDSTPDEEPRSRLDPFRELILRWRRQGKSYRRIQSLLLEKCSVKVSTMTLYEFVQRRSRPRKPQPEPEPELEPATNRPMQTAPARGSTKLTSEEAARQRAILQALRNKAVIAHEPVKKFVYDPDEPLIIDRNIKD